MNKFTLSDRLLAWYDRHGRKDLPWKQTGDPYHIWVSEIMLQQTQVTTVIPYFQRFVERFPDIASLAKADLNEVLHFWTGLGYYARARNLHRAAAILLQQHGAEFPRDYDTVRRLPGIGRSTAGAILALAFDQRHAILDGNVRRILARQDAIGEPLNRRDAENRLWQLAEKFTPHLRVADYTQAMMDLGATVCRRANPDCVQCPLNGSCQARRLGSPQDYPVTTRRKRLPVKSVKMLMIRNDHGQVLLQQRPPTGIWGGLWGFPECTEKDVQCWCREELGLEISPELTWPVLRHTFSHFRLDITPIPARVVGESIRAMEADDTVWYNLEQPDERGFAAPVKRLLEQLR